MYKITATSGTELVSLSDMREYMRIDSYLTADDDMITALISSAREYLEMATGRSMMVHTVNFQVLAKNIFANTIHLPFDVDSISSIEFEGTAIDSSEYTLYNDGQIKLENSYSDGVIEVVYTTLQIDKESLKQCIKEIVKDAYENGDERVRAKRTSVDRVISLFKKFKFT